MNDLAYIGIEADTSKVRSGKDDVRELGEQGARTSAKVSKSTTVMNKAFGSLKSTLRTMAVAGVAALGVLGAGVFTSGAITNARAFNSAMAETSTLIKGTPAQLSAISAASRDMVGSFGGPATAQVKGFYQALSAGAGSVANATTLLDQANKLAIGGVTDVTTGVDALTTAMNAYGPDVLSAAQASDSMFVAMAAGKTTIGELSSSLGQIVPIASAAGVSFDEVTAGISALTTQGLSTAMATTGLRQVIASVIAPTKGATDAAKKMGLQFSVAALKSKGLASFIGDVIEKTGGSEAKMAELFGSVEALGAALSFAGGAGVAFSSIMDEMQTKAGATDAAYAKIAESLNQRWNVVMATARVAAEEFGTALLSIIVPAMEVVIASTEHVGSALKVLGVIIVGLAATQIPAAVAGFAAFTAGMSASAVAAGVFSSALVVARGALIALGGPLGLIYGALGAGASAWVLWRTGAEEGREAAYNAAAGTVALLSALETFRDDTAPSAAAAAIDIANANHKLAASSFAAAKAELAKQRAYVQGGANSGVGGTSGSIRDSGSSASFEKTYTAAALAKLEAAEAGLAAAMRDREVAATTVTGAMSEVMSANHAASESARNLALNLDITGDGLDGVSKKGGGASKALKQVASEADKAADKLKGQLTGAIDSVADAFGDFLAGGLKDFKGFAQAVLGSFQRLISQMVSTAIRSRLTIPIGTSGGLAGSGAAAGVPGVGGGGGLLSGLLGKALGGFGNLGGGLLGGLGGGTGLLGGLGNALSGGLANVFNIAGNAAAAGGGFLATLGAAAPIIGGLVLAFSFFKKKVTELDAGLRLTAQGVNVFADTFSVKQTKRFFGLSKKIGKAYTTLGAGALPYQRALNQIQDSVVAAAATLGVSSDVFENFASSIEVSTKGLSQSEAQAKVEEAILTLGNRFADLVPGLAELQREGESSIDALSRLVVNLESVNGYFDLLGFQMYQTSLAGAAAASEFAALFGSIEAFNTATGAYYQNFYTASERTANATRILTDTLAELGLELPRSRSAFRKLVEEAEMAGDDELLASLIQLAPAFAEITSAANSLNNSLSGNSRLFRTLEDQVFAASGSEAPMDGVEDTDSINDLLREIVRAVREGDINTARISAGILREARREQIEAPL